MDIQDDDELADDPTVVGGPLQPLDRSGTDDAAADEPGTVPGTAAADPSDPSDTDPSDTEDTLGQLPPAMPLTSPTGSAESLQPPAATAGDVLAGRYRLETQLAQRGGTLTWRAFDQKLSRSVLVHLLASHDERTPEVLEAARKAATATDSRFLRVLDAVAGEGTEPSLVVCEFAPGESLERLLRQGPLSALEAAWIARELADAMSSMHAEGLFHQRINPDTVVITATGNVKIVGFLIEAAMHPDADQGTLVWSEREEADVQAIGKVLYCSLVNRWPLSPEQAQAHPVGPNGELPLVWGMPPAPADKRGWLSPRQVRAGVSPALDTICDQVLSPAPRQNEMPLRTASQVMLALNKVLGTADASPDLERRLRYPVQSLETSGAETTGTMPAYEHTGPQTPVPAPRPVEAPRGSSRGPQSATVSARVAPQGPDETVLRGARLARPRPRPANRRWLVILLALAMLVLCTSLARAAWKGLHGGGQKPSAAPAAPTTHQPTSVDDFDPVGDGGNAEENPNLVKQAWDGNPKTAWQSLVYLNNPKFGKLKHGVGLVVDLGQQVEVGRVKVSIEGGATGVQLRVPKDGKVEQAPSKSASEWRVVAEDTAATGTVTLAPKATVTTRYVLVYLTSLPKLSGNKYRGGIAEITVER